MTGITSGPMRQPDRGLVIALHCSGAGAAQWRQLGAALASGFTLRAPEHYGTASTGPWTGEHAFNLADEAARTIALIDGSKEESHPSGRTLLWRRRSASRRYGAPRSYRQPISLRTVGFSSARQLGGRWRGRSRRDRRHRARLCRGRRHGRLAQSRSAFRKLLEWAQCLERVERRRPGRPHTLAPQGGSRFPRIAFGVHPALSHIGVSVFPYSLCAESTHRTRPGSSPTHYGPFSRVFVQ